MPFIEKMLAEHPQRPAALYTDVVDSQYSPACVRIAARSSQPRSLDRSLPRWETVTGHVSAEQEPDLSPGVQRICEFAQRIEVSAESSSAWARLEGEELSGLRLSFRNLLRQMLEELEPGEVTLSQELEVAQLSVSSNDLILIYRFACLLLEAAAACNAGVAGRAEVGFRMANTELTCFLAERSAGVTIRRNDNLFALCSSGDWRCRGDSAAPSLALIDRAVEDFGGRLSVEGLDGVSTKVTFVF